MGTLETITEWVVGLILVYLLISHGDAVVNILRSTGGFVTAESKILQGR